nr:uncharacterized protein LOC128694279 [Cherax quadricarinatus]XP_053640316.1 uncharacterized protein LOC128694279 [Cherax quadricarinatus]XP_053640317.1 uncharacterized protein LOC128694279 [Cherax quadricarinatus]
MSAVALERQYLWRPNLQDLSSHIQPPASLHPPTCILNSPRQLTYLPAAHLAGSHNLNTSIIAASSQSQILPSHTDISYQSQSLHLSSTSLVKKHSALQNPTEGHPRSPTLALSMHAQANSASLVFNAIEDILAPRKLSSEVLELEPSCAPHSFAASIHHSTCSQNSGATTTLTHLKANDSTDSDKNPSSCCCCRGRGYSKGNSARGMATKCKGVSFPRRRLTDEEGYIRRAACVCLNKEETQVMLVSSKKDPCVWLVPGGGLEPGEDTVTAARREAWEEAGIQGHIARYLGLFESFHHSGLKKHRTAVYIFIVTEEHADFPEARLGRRRQWFSMEEALLHLARHRPLQSAYLQFLMMSKLKVAAAS